MRVAIKRPKKKPYFADVKNKLECLQRAVDGYIETVTLGGIVLIVDEEGLLKGKQYNCSIHGIDLYGTVIFCGTRGENFTALPLTAAEFKEEFPELYEED